MAKKPDNADINLARSLQLQWALGCDETGEAFEKAFSKIVPPKRSNKREKGEKLETKKPSR